MTDPLAASRLTIDLDAIAENWRILRDQATHGQCAAVVKGNAYGLGAAPVAQALAAAGCRLFFVAHLAEGIALRAALGSTFEGAGIEIAVLNGVLPHQAAAFAAHDLIPVLNDAGQVAEWLAWCRSHGAARPAILHVDTGMNRLGLRPAEFDDLIEHGDVAEYPWRLVMTHLACADDRDHPMNQEQRQRFAAVRARLPAVPASLAASSGVFLGPDFHADLLRPGVALYGVNPAPWMANPMRQVVELSTQILQVRSIDRGEAVGYGATHRMERDGRIATLAYGYSDGYIRSGSGRGTLYLAGHALPIVGRISMDLITVDASAVPESLLHPGAWVEILGPHRSVDTMARDLGTIGYEVLNLLGQRAARTYRGAVAMGEEGAG